MNCLSKLIKFKNSGILSVVEIGTKQWRTERKIKTFGRFISNRNGCE